LRQLAVIAVASVVLGLAIQVAILVARLLAGSGYPGVAWFPDATQGVAWSVLVCVGVGIGAAILRVRALLAGILGMIFAPIAVALAKASQRLVAGMVEVAEQQAVLSLGTVSMMRAVEYGVLGFLLGTLIQRGERRLTRYLASGAAVGIVLGGAVVALTWHTAAGAGSPMTPPALAASVINEMIFPLGCALVIYAGLTVGQTFRRVDLTLT
jgi:hypothetical protein